jgi:OFA family oxalate/formate antiporter-like MFS transporter
VFPALYVMREQVIAFYILLAVAYYCYGTQLSVYACTSADFYGTKNIGLNYALLFTAWGIAGILGPILGGRVYVVTGDYRLAFFIAAGAEVIALIALAFARNPHRAVVPAMAAG